MANPSVVKATLVTNAVGLGNKTFDLHQQKALEVYFRAATLAAIGGTNYLSSIGTLEQAATNVFRDVNSDQRKAMMLAMMRSNANASGASVSTAIATLATAIRGYESYSDDSLEMMNLLLIGLTGASKAYPQ